MFYNMVCPLLFLTILTRQSHLYESQLWKHKVTHKYTSLANTVVLGRLSDTTGSLHVILNYTDLHVGKAFS